MAEIPENPVIGDRIEIYRNPRIIYKSAIWDIMNGELYLVAIPSLGGTLMPLFVGDVLTLVFFREIGRYVMKVKVIGFHLENTIRIAVFEVAVPPIRDQQREYFRITINSTVTVYEMIDDDLEDSRKVIDNNQAVLIESLVAADISVSGIAILSRKHYILEKKYLLDIFLNDITTEEPCLTMIAEVVRIIPTHRAGLNRIGMRFMSRTETTDDFLAKHLLQKQREQLAAKRL